MIEAEQYFSADSYTARSTAARRRSWPVTTNCMVMVVNTLGGSAARSASISTQQS